MSIVNQPYTDQIWTSGCVPFEHSLQQLLTKIIKDKDVIVSLVDSIDSTYLNHPRIVTDNILNIKKPYIQLWPEYWGSFSYNPQYTNSMPTRLFNCFINRTCPMRQSWFYQLVRQGLIDKGAVSFLLDYRKSLAPIGLDIENKHALYEWVFNQGCEIFASEHNAMRDKIPYQNFTGDLDQTIVNSKISLVIETYFDNNSIISFSEKIFRALQLPRPFVLFGSIGSVDILKRCGFDVYNDLVDHDYDLEDNHIIRQMKILECIKNFDNFSYTQKILDDFESRAEYNRMLLKKFKDTWPDKLKKVIQEISKISNNRVAGLTSM